MQHLTTEHPADIGRRLQSLCERWLLVSDNRRRWTTYRLAGMASPVLPSPQTSRSIGSSPDSAGRPPDSTGSRSAEVAVLEDPALRAIAAGVSGRRGIARPIVQDVIRWLCTGRLLSADQLGSLLGRNANWIRAEYLKPMVREGALRLRFPEAPNRPDQAYSAASER